MAETDDEELLVTHVLTEEEMLIEGLNTSFSEKNKKDALNLQTRRDLIQDLVHHLL